jgi:hypothetical protein
MSAFDPKRTFAVRDYKATQTEYLRHSTGSGLPVIFASTCPEILKSGLESGDRASAQQAHIQSSWGRFRLCCERIGFCH